MLNGVIKDLQHIFRTGHDSIKVLHRCNEKLKVKNYSPEISGSLLGLWIGYGYGLILTFLLELFSFAGFIDY